MADRKEYLRKYHQTPEFKLKNAQRQKVRQLETKRRNTMKRIQEHTIDELMKIVEDTCVSKGVDYNSIKDEYLEFMLFLHDPVKEISIKK